MSTLKFYATICLLLFILIISNNAKEELYVERFELVQLPKLMARPIEQNLTFNVGQTAFTFRLIPSNSILIPDTNIQLIANDKGNTTTNTIMNIFNFASWNFDGFMIGRPFNTISGTVNRKGQFEGFFIYDNSTYFLQLRNKFQSDRQLFNDDDSTILVQMSDICRRPVINNRTKYESSESLYEDLIKVCANDTTASVEQLLETAEYPCYESILGEMALEANSSNVRRSTPPPNAATYLCNLKIVLDWRYFKYVAKEDKDLAVSITVSLLTKVDKIFRSIDFNDDGIADNIGFYIDNIAIYRDPIRQSLNQSASWDPIRFFQEMREYDFTGACVGLLFTFREMQSSEDRTPSLIKTQLINDEQGICSTLKTGVPKSSMADYGEVIANALPINFRLSGHPACDNAMVVQILHQIGHLFGAPDDDFYGEDDACCKKMKGHTYAMATPIPNGEIEEHHCYSSCSIMAMANFLSKSPRPCLRICEGLQCNYPLLGMKPVGHLITRNYTTTSTYKTSELTSLGDWTEYCFTVPRNEAYECNDCSTDILIYFIAFLLAVVKIY